MLLRSILVGLAFGLIMKQSLKFSISVWVAVLLSNATGVAAPQLSGELGRGFPYLSGGEWTWGPWVFFFILIIILSIAGMVIDKLKDHPWWHTLIVVVATRRIRGRCYVQLRLA